MSPRTAEHHVAAVLDEAGRHDAPRGRQASIRAAAGRIELGMSDVTPRPERGQVRASASTYGQSRDGVPLMVYGPRTRASGRTLWLAGIHGDELETIAVLSAAVRLVPRRSARAARDPVRESRRRPEGYARKRGRGRPQPELPDLRLAAGAHALPLGIHGPAGRRAVDRRRAGVRARGERAARGSSRSSTRSRSSWCTRRWP